MLPAGGVSPTGARPPPAGEGAKAGGRAKRFTPFGNGIRNCVGAPLPPSVCMLRGLRCRRRSRLCLAGRPARPPGQLGQLGHFAGFLVCKCASVTYCRMRCRGLCFYMEVQGRLELVEQPARGRACCAGQQLATINIPTAVAMLVAEFQLALAPEILDKGIQDLEITRGTLQPEGAILMRCTPRRPGGAALSGQ